MNYPILHCASANRGNPPALLQNSCKQGNRYFSSHIFLRNADDALLFLHLQSKHLEARQALHNKQR
jgi:hypothetical protein